MATLKISSIKKVSERRIPDLKRWCLDMTDRRLCLDTYKPFLQSLLTILRIQSSKPPFEVVCGCHYVSKLIGIIQEESDYDKRF